MNWRRSWPSARWKGASGLNPERETLYRGLSHAAWGYFFLHIHFKVNNVDLLPVFVGWLLLLSACRKLCGARRDLALLRPLAVLMAAWHGVDWLLSWGNARVGGHVLFLDLLVAVAVLYFHFQFLTDMAALAEHYQPEESGLDGKLCRRRTVYLLVCTLVDILLNLPMARVGEVWGYIGVGLAFAGIVAALFIMAALFQLRRWFREAEGSPEE